MHHATLQAPADTIAFAIMRFRRLVPRKWPADDDARPLASRLVEQIERSRFIVTNPPPVERGNGSSDFGPLD